MKLKGSKTGRTLAMLQNASASRAVSLEFSTQELPCFTLWKNTNSEAAGYVTGLEPGTNFPHPRGIERAMGRVPQLAAGETREFTLQFGIHADENAVKSVTSRIAKLQGKTAPKLDKKPETQK